MIYIYVICTEYNQKFTLNKLSMKKKKSKIQKYKYFYVIVSNSFFLNLFILEEALVKLKCKLLLLI